MKMRQVCEETGLTEKAVRLYIKQELVHPTVTEGLHNTSYDFSTEDISQLKIVAALRAADFSMADIREIQLHPEQLPDFLAEHKQMLQQDIRRKQAVTEALDRLSAAESGSLEAVANSMRPAQRQELERNSESKLPVIVLILCCVLVLLLTFWKEPLFALIAAGMLPMFGGIACAFMAVRYATCTSRAKKLPNRAVGTVISVVKQTGYDAAFSMQTVATVGAPRWGGSGGIWAMFFMLWGELRPDHWVPVIQFTDQNGKLQSGTFPYGGLKSCFREGDRVEIAWEKYPARVHPLEAPWLKWKGLIYLVYGVLLFAVGLALFIAAMEYTVML